MYLAEEHDNSGERVGAREDHQEEEANAKNEAPDDARDELLVEGLARSSGISTCEQKKKHQLRVYKKAI